MFVIPAVYLLWKQKKMGRRLPEPTEPERD
jgi:hypothetical protein